MLHPDVVDLSLRVPANMKMRGSQLRSFYKSAMRDFLPTEIIHKKKHGFGLPFGLWLERSAPLAQLIDANLAGLRKRSLIRPDFIDQLRQLHGQSDASYYGVFVWTLAALEQWLGEHRLESA
jgi:asparagine synthase (glutamine-hydrolysing)